MKMKSKIAAITLLLSLGSGLVQPPRAHAIVGGATANPILLWVGLGLTVSGATMVGVPSLLGSGLDGVLPAIAGVVIGFAGIIVLEDEATAVLLPLEQGSPLGTPEEIEVFNSEIDTLNLIHQEVLGEFLNLEASDQTLEAAKAIWQPYLQEISPESVLVLNRVLAQGSDR